MLRKLVHVEVRSETGSSNASVPCCILIREPNVQWFNDHEKSILSELCKLISQNYKQIETNAAAYDPGEPPSQLVGEALRVAYAPVPRLEGASYTLLSARQELAESFDRIELTDFTLDPLWIFPMDENDPNRHAPLDI